MARNRDPTRDKAYRAPAPDVAESDREPPALPSQGLKRAYAKARILREHYRAQREKLEYEQQVGNLGSLEGVKEAWHAAVVEFRDAIQNAAVEIGKTLAAKYGLDTREVVAITAGEMQRALEELGDHLRKRCQEYERTAVSKRED